MKVYLVDNPGFGETNRQAQRTAQDAMANSSIYVVCMDYEHTEGTKQFIRHFLSKMDGIDVNIVFVVLQAHSELMSVCFYRFVFIHH